MTGAIVAEEIVLPGREHDPGRAEAEDQEAKAEQRGGRSRTDGCGGDGVDGGARGAPAGAEVQEDQGVRVVHGRWTFRDEQDALERGDRDEPHVLARDVVDPASGEVLAGPIRRCRRR